MYCHRALFSLLTVLSLVCLIEAVLPQIVDLGYAIYQGNFNSSSNITDFFSIRYAAPPVGKLRFQKPAPPPNMRAQGVQLANIQPPACPSASEGNQITTPFRNLSTREDHQIEDCLFLNVHVSGIVNPRARMPVVFFIHGGGYVSLSTAGLNGADLVTEAGGEIVAVELEYRLGVFGFLPGKEVKKEGALNAGLLDQQFALQWVQQNIHLFGGDPRRVTIWGESAGAGSVLQHLVAHGGDTQPPLFHQAITSSTYLPSQYNFDDPIPEKVYSEFVRLTGCSNATDTFQCLSEVDAETLENANVEVNESGFFGTYVTVPVVDGDFIVERPIQTIELGKLNTERLMAMTNMFEGGIFVNSNYSAQMTVADYVTQLFPLFNQSAIDETVRQYTNIGLETVNDQAVAIMGESIFICPTYRLLDSLPGSYKGLFAVPPGLHAYDLPYYFPDILGVYPSVAEYVFNNTQFQHSFAGSFLGFVKFGDPNVRPFADDNDDITPSWKPFIEGQTEMLFNRTEDFRPDVRAFTTDSGLIERCEFWKRLAPFVPQ